MPPVDPVQATGLYTNTVTPTQDRKQSLDSDVFMQLLVTQLKNQDPSSPMNTNEMISQTTQLAMMEQLTEMTTTSTENFALSMRQTAAALVGQQASYYDAEGTEQTGLVTSVSFAQSVPQVTIGDKTIPLDAVSGVSSISTAS